MAAEEPGPLPHPPGARPAGAGDLPALQSLASLAAAELGSARGGPQLLAELAARDTAAMRTAAVDGGGSAGVHVGLLGDVVVGWATWSVSGVTATLHEMWVQPEARCVGVGSCLLAAVGAAAAERGAMGLDATVLPGDRSTKNFFEDHHMVARSITVHRSLAAPDESDPG